MAGAEAVADRLSLAAAPTFAAMAVLNLSGSGPQAICVADPGMFPLQGMAMMYLLMAFFHLAPWLRLVERLRPAPSEPE